ncbi:transcription initiation factor TFIID subunit 8, partial [Cryptotermes secundus]
WCLASGCQHDDIYVICHYLADVADRGLTSRSLWALWAQAAQAVDALVLSWLSCALVLFGGCHQRSSIVICQVGISAQSYCELSGRTEPVIGDVIVALVNMGLPLDGIEMHARRPGRTMLSAPVPSTQPKQLSILQAGVKQPHPPHIPINLPQFPDPHAYIRTPTHKQPVTEYEAIREKSASQKRDTERALTRFVAKTSETHSLFLTEDTMFPLVACKPHRPPYLKALLPSDQVFEFEDEFSIPSCPTRGGPGPSRKVRSDAEGEEEENLEEGKENAEEGKGGEIDTIDNPYLRPIKLPRKKKPKI